MIRQRQRDQTRPTTNFRGTILWAVPLTILMLPRFNTLFTLLPHTLWRIAASGSDSVNLICTFSCCLRRLDMLYFPHFYPSRYGCVGHPRWLYCATVPFAPFSPLKIHGVHGAWIFATHFDPALQPSFHEQLTSQMGKKVRRTSWRPTNSVAVGVASILLKA